MSWDKLSAAVDAEVDSGLEDLFAAVRIPSVGQRADESLRESADYLQALLMRDGWAAEVVEVGRNPAVFAEIGMRNGEAPSTVLFYGHHDTQPPEPIDVWQSPPFSPVIRDGRIFGRGASDDKGQFFSHIFAVRAILRVLGRVPVHAKFILDGQEENMSPDLDGVIAQLGQRLRADFMYTADGPADITGRPRLTFGFRGLVQMMLKVRTADVNVHSGAWGNLAPNAALRLAQILAEIKGTDGQVAVPGFYEHVKPPTEVERDALSRIPFDSAKAAASIGARGLEGEPGRIDPLERLMFMPTFNVSGIVTGYNGPGFQGAIPCEATARIDMSFVPDQDPHELFELVRDFVTKIAPDASTEFVSHMPTSRTPLDTPVATRVVAALRQGYGRDPLLYPSSGGAGPEGLFTRTLGIPSLWCHGANYDHQNHAPNENLSLEYLKACARSTASLIIDLGSNRDGLSAKR